MSDSNTPRSGTPALEVQAHDVVVAKVDEQVVVVVDGNITVSTQDFSYGHLERILEAIGMDFAGELVADDDDTASYCQLDAPDFKPAISDL